MGEGRGWLVTVGTVGTMLVLTFVLGVPVAARWVWRVVRVFLWFPSLLLFGFAGWLASGSGDGAGSAVMLVGAWLGFVVALFVLAFVRLTWLAWSSTLRYWRDLPR
jgi:hypothetical protein